MWFSGPVEGVFDVCNSATDVFVKTLEPALDNRPIILYQSNLYATKKGKTLQLDSNELLSFIGINFFMGYHIVPGWKNYWSTCSDIGVPHVANTTSRNRFEIILSYLHVNDNTFLPPPGTDKLYKIRPLVASLNHHFLQIYNVNRDVSIADLTNR